jgi:hypothetical protein
MITRHKAVSIHRAGKQSRILTTNSATLGSEFDFQEGDIIAVTATPPDGWWSGKLDSMARPDQETEDD